MGRSAEPYPRGEPTRAAILAAAETVFAEQGFEGARLEEIAQRVGIRRPAISYYFSGKKALYDTVLDELFGGLFERLRPVLERQGPLLARIEAAVGVGIDYLAAHPALARILLREVAAGRGGRVPRLARYIEPFYELVQRLEAETANDPLAEDSPVDPILFASTIVGTTVFMVAAIPVLAPESELDALDPETLAAHRSEILRLTRRLLGIRATRRRPNSTNRPDSTEEASAPRERAGRSGPKRG